MAINFKLMDPAPPISVEAWRGRARRALPDIAWRYLDGGADDLVTLGENVSGFANYRLRQRCLTGVRSADLSTVMARQAVSMPLALAPCGITGLMNWRGDVAAIRAAEQAGTRAVLSTSSSYTLEEVAEATDQSHWFQLYPFGNRDKVRALMARAKAAGYTALFVTVDVPVLGNREGERLAGMTHPWTLTPSRVLNMASRPAWLMSVLRHRRISAIHYVERESQRRADAGLLTGVMGAGDDAVASAENQARYMQGDLNWDDLAWMRDQWDGPVYVKGVLDPDDAARAVDTVGVDGVVVSNHGGRQLDRTRASIDALPAILDRIGDRAEVYLDGGMRRGTDVITALALGARGVFIGRPYLYGLAAGGEAGVASVLDILRAEMERALILMGCPSVSALDRSWLVRRDAVASREEV